LVHRERVRLARQRRRELNWRGPHLHFCAENNTAETGALSGLRGDAPRRSRAHLRRWIDSLAACRTPAGRHALLAAAWAGGAGADFRDSCGTDFRGTDATAEAPRRRAVVLQPSSVPWGAPQAAGDGEHARASAAAEAGWLATSRSVPEGCTLKDVLQALVARLGWEGLIDRAQVPSLWALGQTNPPSGFPTGRAALQLLRSPAAANRSARARVEALFLELGLDAAWRQQPRAAPAELRDEAAVAGDADDPSGTQRRGGR
jgi:uncharacterized protein (DUF2132 family)